MVDILGFRRALGLSATRFKELEKAVGRLNHYFIDPIQLLDMRFCELPPGHKALE